MAAPQGANMMRRTTGPKGRAMKSFVVIAPLLAVAILGACAVPQPAPPYVVATLQPTLGNSAAGTVWFTRDGTELRVVGRISGLTPNRQHGFHIHQKGDCSSGDGMSAGGHFNPTSQPHGAPAAAHHAGDLPALTADAAGDASFSILTTGSVLTGGATDVAGKALIVHADPDDYSTQPTGNSGARIACGVISQVASRDDTGRDVPMSRNP